MPMTRPTPRALPTRPQILAERAVATLQRFMHIEAVSGFVLLLAACVALIWANSSFADSYHALWHLPLSISLGSFAFTRELHFWVNDALMTAFFLVVGMEIRREMHEGALNDLRKAAMPVVAAFGGVIVPALIYVALNGADPLRRAGWAIPTATDIAFAVGVLALLGRSIPGNLRVFLLTLAIIDDVIAVLIIAFFYSGGLDYTGFLFAGGGILMVLALQQIGVGSAFAYVFPGAMIWVGLLITGAHPSLAGVVLGLMTPVRAMPLHESPAETVTRIAGRLGGGPGPDGLAAPLRQLRVAGREMLPPVLRVQMALHPWVAYGVMPIFALANAGVSLGRVDLSASGAQWVMGGVAVALIVGKPVGVLAATWLMVRLRLGVLPEGIDWAGILLIGLLAGIGFTMSIFVTMLAFADANLLNAAKLGVLLGSCVAAVLALGWGVAYRRRLASQRA